MNHIATSEVLEIRRAGDVWTVNEGAGGGRFRSPHRSEIEAQILDWAGPMGTEDRTMEPAEPIATGQELALRLQAAYPNDDWIALLMERSGETRDKIERHLQESMVPTGPILLAAGLLLDEAQQRGEAGGTQAPV